MSTPILRSRENYFQILLDTYVNVCIIPRMYCSIKEAAEIIGVSRPTIYRMIEDGELKREIMLGRPALKLSDVKKRARKPATNHQGGRRREGK